MSQRKAYSAMSRTCAWSLPHTARARSTPQELVGLRLLLRGKRHALDPQEEPRKPIGDKASAFELAFPTSAPSSALLLFTHNAQWSSRFFAGIPLQTAALLALSERADQVSHTALFVALRYFHENVVVPTIKRHLVDDHLLKPLK